MRKFVRILFNIFLLAYIAALGIWCVGTFGLFGTDKDPLSGVFLVVLGQPWVQLVDRLAENLWPVATALSPLPTLIILYVVHRRWH